MKNSALLTDLYELTMMQGYFLYERDSQVVFDMFFRTQPFNSGFSVFAGLEDMLKAVEGFSFSADDIDYLSGLNLFHDSFLEYLRSFRFTGDIYSMSEGTLIFPGEPLLRVHGSLIEAQLIESMLLNTINFQSLVATKAARIYHASEGGKILEFGLRRAQGWDGALSATRAAYIGGALATSNTLGGKTYGVPVSGTMAHSWIMAFRSELESFEIFAELYPDKAILLIDTFDTLGSGIENAIKVGKMLKKQGKRMGVRLDSGDLSYLSQKVRKKLDAAGLEDAYITVSNDLNEEIIHQLVTDKAPIDMWGVGTNLVTGGSTAAFSGVYKLSAKTLDGLMVPTMKVSNNIEKTTNPGAKQVYRFYDDDQMAIADLITLEEEDFNHNRPHSCFHPMYPNTYFTLYNYKSAQPLIEKKMKNGKICAKLPDLADIREHTLEQMLKFDPTYKRIINPHIYKISLSRALKNLKNRMIDEFKHEDR
ncbi:MAG TPA: nicotinate phosphoribosyltransferase [Clostridia bacterium]|nr:nicotinate phosphoribosyltransferase [Clostridia bacterium]